MPEGARVVSITESSPAESAGLQENDIITQANDTAISGSEDLVSFVKTTAVGDEVTLTVYRSGETIEVTVTIGAQTSSALANEDTSAESTEGTTEESSGQSSDQGNSQNNGQSNNQGNSQKSFPFGNFGQ